MVHREPAGGVAPVSHPPWLRIAAIACGLGSLIAADAAPEPAPETVPAADPDPEWYERVSVAVVALGAVQSTAGVDEQLSSEGDVTDALAKAYVELTAPIGERGEAFVFLESGTGGGIDEEVPTWTGFFDEADDDDRVRLGEAWYEHRFAGDRAQVRLGRIDATVTLDTSPYAGDGISQFASTGFVLNAAIPYPDYGFGVAAWYAPDETPLRFGAQVVDGEGDNEDVVEDAFAMVEAVWQADFGGRPGSYSVHAWFAGAEQSVFADPGETDPAFGVGLGIDQELGDAIGVWLRYGFADPALSEVAHALSLGASIATAVVANGGETLGIGYALSVASDDFTDAVGDRDPEHHLEIYWRWDLGHGLAVTPDLQYVHNPAGDPTADGVAAFILRGELSF